MNFRYAGITDLTNGFTISYNYHAGRNLSAVTYPKGSEIAKGRHGAIVSYYSNIQFFSCIPFRENPEGVVFPSQGDTADPGLKYAALSGQKTSTWLELGPNPQLIDGDRLSPR